MDWTLVLGSFVISIVVGLTGMGGGALMTPMLTLIYGFSPLTAVSSDLVASAVSKPVSAAVHIRNKNVRWDLVRWLCVGSVPAAFCGVLIARSFGSGQTVENVVQKSLGVALIIAAAGLFARSYLRLAERAKHRDGSRDADPNNVPDMPVRPVPTVAMGAIGGVIVGMTSVGSGSLIIVALMLLYPKLRASQLVGTDLVQAVPLVASAAVSQMIFGNFVLSVTTSLLVGSIPGAYIGAQLSSRLPGALIRRALAFVLLASALKSLNLNNTITVVTLVVVAVMAGPIWMLLRRANGFPAWPAHERRAGETEQAPIDA